MRFYLLIGDRATMEDPEDELPVAPPQLSYDEAEHDSQVPPVPSAMRAWWAGVLG